MIRNVAHLPHFAQEPALGILCTADSALDAVVGALRARHPRLDHTAALADPWHRDLRAAQILASAAHTMQALLTDYYGTLLDQACGDDTDDDIDF
jgi:hypothetical protein